MSKKQKQIGVTVTKDDNDENIQYVKINDDVIGTIEEKDDKIFCTVGENTFHENSEEEAVQQVIREYNLHQS